MKYFSLLVFVVQSVSCVQLFGISWTAAHQALLSSTTSQSFLKFMSLESVILCCSLFLLPLVFPSVRIFSSETALHIRWPKCWSFHFSICPSSKQSVLISFRIDWFDLLAAQGTLKSLLQHHTLKVSVHWRSAFFMVQSHLYMTTGKSIALTIQTFVGKVRSLLFNTLSRFSNRS